MKDETEKGSGGATVRAQLEDGRSRVFTSATDERPLLRARHTLSGTWVLTIERPASRPRHWACLSVLRAGRRISRWSSSGGKAWAVGVLAGVDPKVMSSQLDAAAQLFDAGQYDQPIAAYRAIKVKAPALTSVDLQLGMAYLRMKSYREAETAFLELLKSDENHPRASYGMGEAKEASGTNVEEALEWYRKAAANDPLWGKPLLKLAELARSSGDREAAVKYLTQIVERDPGSPEATQAAAMLKQMVDSR